MAAAGARCGRPPAAPGSAHPEDRSQSLQCINSQHGQSCWRGESPPSTEVARSGSGPVRRDPPAPPAPIGFTQQTHRLPACHRGTWGPRGLHQNGAGAAASRRRPGLQLSEPSLPSHGPSLTSPLNLPGSHSERSAACTRTLVWRAGRCTSLPTKALAQTHDAIATSKRNNVRLAGLGLAAKRSQPGTSIRVRTGFCGDRGLNRAVRLRRQSC